MMLQGNKVALTILSSAFLATAEVPVWGQCGGIGWVGSTKCVSGLTCTEYNDYYSRCILDGQGSTTATTHDPGTPTDFLSGWIQGHGTSTSTAWEGTTTDFPTDWVPGSGMTTTTPITVISMSESAGGGTTTCLSGYFPSYPTDPTITSAPSTESAATTWNIKGGT